MKKNKYIKIFLFSLLIFLFLVFLFQYFNKVKNADFEVNKVPTIEAPRLVSGNIKNKKDIVNKISDTKEVAPELDVKKISIKIVVEDKVYESSIKEEGSVYQAMLDLSSENKDFTFTSKDYSGMGMFVDSINGVHGQDGKYWIYYLNDKKASVGISKNLLKDGDTVRWEREGMIN